MGKEFEKEREKGSDHGHNRVSTYAGITITIVYPNRMVMMILYYCSHVVRANINVWLC